MGGDPTVARVPALDGLRGMAVAVVLLYHADILPGGFLGVDAFFVVSGFLITSLLLAEHDRSGRIDLRAFWGRRARRLVPAMLLLLAGVALFAVTVAPATQLARIRGDALATLGYVANWRFVLSGESYTDLLAAPSPLRHVWSLAVEEQWYLLWPILVATVLRWSGGRRRPLVVTSLGLAAASVTVLHVVGNDVDRAYYGTDARAFALLAGALVALVHTHRPIGGRRFEGAALVGGVVLGALVVMAHDGDPWLYRSGGLVLAAAAAAAIVGGVLAGRGVVARLLAASPLQAVGRVSYALYLFHWPVYLWLTPARTGLDDGPLLVLRAVVSLGLAASSTSLIEEPVRRGTWALRPVVAGGVLAAGAVVVATSGGSAIPVPVSLHTATAEASEPDATRVLVVGDSLAWSLVFYGRVAPDLEIQAEVAVGCGMQEGEVRTAERVLPRNDICASWRDRWRRAVAVSRPDVVVVSLGAWEVVDQRLDGRDLPFPSPALDRHLRQQLGDAVELLTATGARAVFLSAPCFDQPSDGVNSDGAERNDVRRVEHFNGLLRSVVRQHDAVASVSDVGRWVCEWEARGDPPIRDDGMHFNERGAARAWKLLDPSLTPSRPPIEVDATTHA